MLVSLVGKLAQRGKRWEDREGAEAVHRWGQWHHVQADGTDHQYRSLAGRVQRQTLQGWGPQAVPAISAWIYSEGRMRLWDAQLIAGRDEVYYCHTDSLFASETGYRRLVGNCMVAAREPGKLTLKAVHEWMYIHGISHYDTPHRRVRSGVARSGDTELTELAAGNYMETVSQALGERRPPLPIVRSVPQLIGRAYRHGIRNSDGTVSPWRVE